jgi:hypothetical protein
LVSLLGDPDRLGVEERLLHECAQVLWNAWEKTGRSDAAWASFYGQVSVLKYASRSFFSLSPDWPVQIERWLRIGEEIHLGHSIMHGAKPLNS